jgi:hypothetical protein
MEPTMELVRLGVARPAPPPSPPPGPTFAGPPCAVCGRPTMIAAAQGNPPGSAPQWYLQSCEPCHHKRLIGRSELESMTPTAPGGP